MPRTYENGALPMKRVEQISKERSWPQNCRQSGECGLIRRDSTYKQTRRPVANPGVGNKVKSMFIGDLSSRPCPEWHMTSSKASLAFAVVVGVFAAVYLSTAKAAASFYILDGQQIRMVPGDPATVYPDLWAVFYFRQGVATDTSSNRWGMDVGSTAENVRQAVERSQKFEKRYEKWCGCSWGTNTFFNPLYPIAITSSSSTRYRFTSYFSAYKIELLKTSRGVLDRISALMDTVNNANDLSSEPRWFPEWRGPALDALRLIHKRLDKFFAIREQISAISDAAMHDLAYNFDKAHSESFSNDLERVRSDIASLDLNHTSAVNSTVPRGLDCVDDSTLLGGSHPQCCVTAGYHVCDLGESPDYAHARDDREISQCNRLICRNR